jgi:hypothetical protein
LRESMPLTPRELVERLGDGALLVRTGVALVTPQQLRGYQSLAQQWGAEGVDLAELRLEQLPEGARYLGLSAMSLLADLDVVASGIRSHRCALVANADLFLARLADRERSRVWDFLFYSLRKRPTGLLLLLPNGAEHLFSSVEADRWVRAARLCRIGVAIAAEQAVRQEA